MGCGSSAEAVKLAHSNNSSFSSASSCSRTSRRHRQIERQLRADAERSSREVKLLLLGASECGKSTVLKQMTIIHGRGYSQQQRLCYRARIFTNTLHCMLAMLKAVRDLGIWVPDMCSFRRDVDFVSERLRSAEEGRFSQELALVLQRLWQSQCVQEAYSRSSEYQLNDSTAYYLNSLLRLADPDYVPTVQDVLRCRLRTTGIVETKFYCRHLQFCIFDVGGQRPERKKWMHCFDSVTAILFLVALSEYDLRLAEDPSTNRMHESLRIFDSICNSPWFENTSIILFLNKRDLFAEKIGRSPLKYCFPEYEGPNTYEAAGQYIQIRFEQLNTCKETTVYSHFTCATDTDSMKVMLDAVTDIVIKNNLKDCGLF